ncbi:hypothetical protein C8T65DRAFT_770405 [Cerioporus squamosus]|nr:hypothetical protein C8T65DRAFT_770405 [Cerioporus squamosus]
MRGPVTRSARRSQASSSKHTLDHDESPESADSGRDEEIEETSVTLQALLRRALKGAKSLERENEGLHKKVKALEGKLERVQDADELSVKPKRSRRAAGSVSELQKEVQRLRNQVRKLEKSKEKYRKRVHELSMREVKKDADELVDDAEFEVGDTAYKMRKLLREFHDLMVANVLGQDGSEDCPICLEPLQLKECSSFPCEHIYCNGCLLQLKPVPDSYRDDVESIQCPTCRAVFPRDELESVDLTSIKRWDALLDVAKKWAKMDLRRQEDTSEEEGEEEFIDDEETNNARLGRLPLALSRVCSRTCQHHRVRARAI